MLLYVQSLPDFSSWTSRVRFPISRGCFRQTFRISCTPCAHSFLTRFTKADSIVLIAWCRLYTDVLVNVHIHVKRMTLLLCHDFGSAFNVGNCNARGTAPTMGGCRQSISFAQRPHVRGDTLPSTSEQSFPSRLLAQAIDELGESPATGFVPQ